MKKLYYNEKGYLCNKHPWDIPVTDENRFFVTDEETFNKTDVCPIYHSWKVEGDKLVIAHYDDMPEEMKLEEQKFLLNNEIEEKKEYLSQTDYVITKINEAQAYGDDEEVTALKTQYSEILLERKECRTRINELEEQLKALG